MRHKLLFVTADLVFIALIAASANGQNQMHFPADELSVSEPASGHFGDLSESAPLGDTPVSVPLSDPKPIDIPADTMAGMLIHKADPEYPRLAKAARISGIVTVNATISKTGEIVDLHVQCGPKILQEPALKAIREWKYRPYLLNGESVEVQTTIKVIFTLGGKKKLPFSKDSCPVE
jgi:TonB family protein